MLKLGTERISTDSKLETDHNGPQILEQPASNSREEGATLSPPHTWTESAESPENDEAISEILENRHLFSVQISLPDGMITHARLVSEAIPKKDLQVGTNLFPHLLGKGQSFILSAAVTSNKQRIFCRVRCGHFVQACELLCEFEPGRGRITALALKSAFGPSTPFHSLTFTTKHTPSCALTHIDYTSIPYLGHLPTDLIGRSVFAFVYAPDVHVIRQAHIDLHNSRGKVVKSVSPLRFVAHNGAILRAETEWSAYVNPWSKKIELVVARHRILDAPIGDANVLAGAPPGHIINVLPSAMIKTFEEELRTLMHRPVPSRNQVMCQAAPRPADLSSYIDCLVETLVVNGVNPNPPTKCPSVAQNSKEDLPLSYNQINCLENVHRLLKSQRDETPDQKDRFDDRRIKPAVPLTRETLQQHTKKWEEEYRDTWNRRLKRMSGDSLPGSPAPKQARPSTSSTPPQWTSSQREEYYRSLAPNSMHIQGKNYQITTVPLPPIEPRLPVPQERHQSAFTAVQPKSLPIRDLPPPIELSIQDHPSVIQVPSSEPLVVPFHPTSRLLWAHRPFNTSSTTVQQFKLGPDALLMLHEST